MSKLDDLQAKQNRVNTNQLEREESENKKEQEKGVEQERRNEEGILMKNIFNYIKEKFPEIKEFIEKVAGFFEKVKRFNVDGFERGRGGLSVEQLESLESKMKSGKEEQKNDGEIGKSLAENGGLDYLKEQIDAQKDRDDFEGPKTNEEERRVMEELREELNKATTEENAEIADKKKGGE